MKRLAIRWWHGAIAAALVVAAGAIALTTIPPVYQVSLNGVAVVRSRSLPQIEQALRAETKQQLDRQVTLETEGRSWPYRLADLGMSLPPDAGVERFTDASKQLPWWQRLAWNRPDIAVTVEAIWDENRLHQAIAPVATSVHREPVSAKLTIVAKAPVITAETNGADVDVPALLALLKQQPAAGAIQVPISKTAPIEMTATLEALRIKRLVAEWTTEYDPSIPRAENVEKAASAFNGLMIKPDEVLSYNTTVGPIELNTGWKTAPVIVNGKLVPGVGGGVCQVSTTFYGAALRANLDIVERHQHQLAVSYIPPSEDAAIAQGWEDFRLRNNTEGYLLIETESGGGRVTFRIYGDVPAEQTVKIESHVTSSGGPGLSSEAYRLVYRSGELVKRELLSRDYYLPGS